MENANATTAPTTKRRLECHLMWLAAVLSLTFSACAGADTLRLATGSYPPFSDKGLPNGGMSTEIVRLVIAEMGHEADIHFLPWKRGYAETLSGKYFGTFPYISTLERESLFFLSDPFNMIESRVFVPKTSTINYDTLTDLIGKRACNTLGYSHPPPLERLIASGEIRLEKPPEFWMCFKMLEHGRVDFISINEMNGWSIIRDQYGATDGFKVIGPPVDTIGHYLMVAKSYPHAETLLASFNATLARLKSSGVVNEIINRHTARHRQ